MALTKTLWTQIVDLVSTGQEVSNSLDTAFTNIDAAITQVDTNATRLDSLEASHTLVLSASSVAVAQEPSTTDSVLQVEFGPLQTTTDIDISASGDITFNTAGKYIMSTFFQYGRAGSVGTSVLFNRMLINGTQISGSLGAKIDNADALVPWSSSVELTVSANDVMTIEIIRDSAGNDSGGLFSSTPTLVGWNVAPCAAVQIYKAT